MEGRAPKAALLFNRLPLGQVLAYLAGNKPNPVSNADERYRPALLLSPQPAQTRATGFIPENCQQPGTVNEPLHFVEGRRL